MKKKKYTTLTEMVKGGTTSNECLDWLFEIGWGIYGKM
jgi:hypothetical protein